jgi:Zn ribbon nucleic-acid-binding protein
MNEDDEVVCDDLEIVICPNCGSEDTRYFFDTDLGDMQECHNCGNEWTV